MKQYANDGSPVEMELISGELLFIDLLYFQDIIRHKGEVEPFPKGDKVLFIKSLEEKIFPYGGSMLLGFKRVRTNKRQFVFDIQKMQQFDHQNSNLERLSSEKEITAFATDSGTFLILDMANFEKLLDCVTYDELIDASLDNKHENYFQKVNTVLGNRGWAFVITPGVHSGYVFEGSGSFIIIE
jgi:hypothetical protein